MGKGKVGPLLTYSMDTRLVKATYSPENERLAGTQAWNRQVTIHIIGGISRHTGLEMHREGGRPVRSKLGWTQHYRFVGYLK